MRQAVIVAASRTAVGKAVRGNTKNARSDDMAATIISDLMDKTSGQTRPWRNRRRHLGLRDAGRFARHEFRSRDCLTRRLARRYARADG